MVARVSTFFRAFLAAAVAHGVAIATVLRGVAPEDPARALGSHAAVAEWVEIDMFSASEVTEEPKTAPDAMISRAVTPLRPASRSPSERALGHTFTAEAQRVDEPTERDPAGVASEAVTEEPSLSLEQLGLEGPSRVSRTFPEHAGAGPRAAAPRGVAHSMRRMAEAHDREVGLGAGGPVATALEKAAYGSNVALNGQATFEVVVIDNRVSAISLAPSSAEKQGPWNEVAKTALAQLAGRPVRAPTGRRGVVLHIQVVSRAALPSGHDPGLEVTVGPFVLQRGSGKRSARLAFLDSIRLTSAIDLLGAGTPFSAPGAVGNLVRTDIDPVDLGAKGRRVVHTSTLDETPLD